MPFPASIALAVLKYRIKITENNKDDDDNNDNDENDLVFYQMSTSASLREKILFHFFVALLAPVILYRKISLTKSFGMRNKIAENRSIDKL